MPVHRLFQKTLLWPGNLGMRPVGSDVKVSPVGSMTRQSPCAKTKSENPSTAPDTAMYFKNLDSLRTLAAFAVVFQHSMKGLGKFYSEPTATIVNKLTEYGEVGVQFFFVLSGFLITYLLNAEKLNFGRIDLPKFYLRRVLRIWPLFFTVLLISILIVPYFGAKPVENWWLYPSFLSNFDALSGAVANPMARITWSVSIEEQFYLLWPLLFFIKGTVRLLSAIFLVVLGSVIFQFIHLDNQPVFYFHTLSNFFFLSAGGLMGLLSFVPAVSLSDRFAKLGLRPTVLIYAGCFALFLFYDSLYELNKLMTNILAALVFSFVILQQSFGHHLEMHRLKPLSFLGKYTYGIYLLHPIMIFVVSFFPFPEDIPYIKWKCICVFALSILTAMLSYHYMERHFLKLKPVPGSKKTAV